MEGFDPRLLNGIHVMAAVVTGRSFVRAAEALDMSQPSVSRAISRLESRLGLRLFERTTRSVRLTDEGRSFYEQVMPLVHRLEEATAAASGASVAIRGRLRVNIDPFFSRSILAPQLPVFLQRFPHIQLELVARDRLGDLVTEGFDLAIRFGHPPLSNLVGRKLFETRIVTAASPAYLERHGRPATPADLETAAHACLHFRDPSTGRPFPWEFHRRRKKLTVAAHGILTLNDAGTLYSACAAGCGIAQLMEVGARELLIAGRLVDLFPDWPDERFPLYAYYPSRHHVPGKTRALLEFILGETA